MMGKKLGIIFCSGIFLWLMSDLFISRIFWINYHNNQANMTLYNVGKGNTFLRVNGNKNLVPVYIPDLDKPSWAPFLNRGMSVIYKVRPSFRNYEIDLQAQGNGDLVWEFYNRAQAESNKEPKENQKIYIAFSDVFVDGQKINIPSVLSKANRFEYRYPVKDGQKIKLTFKVKRYWSYKELWEAFDVYMFIIAAVVSFLMAYKLVAYLSRFKIEQHHSRIDIVFLCAFFVGLILPMSHISKDAKSEQENRMLATYKPLMTDGEFNYQYGAQLEQWFNDHFFGRNFLIKKYNKIINTISPNGNDSVLLGKDGWAFLKRDGSIDNYKNISSFSDDELASIAAYLTAIDSWAKSHGKDFYFVICPDKNRIYDEYITTVSKVHPDSENRTNKLLAYLKEHTDVKILYLRDTLLDAKKEGILYLKNDTHWTEFGAWFAYKRLMKELSMKYNLPQVTYTKMTTFKNPKGDLNKFYPEMPLDETTEYTRPVVNHHETCDGGGEGDIADVSCTNPHGSKNLLIYRDSFTSALYPYLNNTFAQTTYIWRYNIYARDAEVLGNADIIILEILERMLPKITNAKFPF